MKSFLVPILISVFAVFYSCPVFSQKQSSITKTNSLITQLNKVEQDTNRVIILNELVLLLTEEHYDLALQYADSALQLATKLKYKKGLCTAHSLLGNIHLNYTLSFAEALSEFNSTLELTSISDWKQTQEINSKLAYIHKRQNNYVKSIRYYNTAIQLAEEHNDVQSISKYYSYVAEIYELEQNMELAKEYLLKILELEKSRNFENSEPAALTAIAHYYILQKQYQQAEKYYLDAFAQSKKTNNHRWESYTLNLLASLQLTMNNNAQALDYALQGLNLAEKYKLLKEIGDNHNILTAIYDSQGNHQKAFFHYKAGKEIDDSIFSMEKVKEVARIQAIYDATARQEKLAMLEKEKALDKSELQKTQIIVFALIGGLALMLILSVFLYRNYRTKQLVNKELENRHELQNLKLDEIIHYLNTETEEHKLTKAQLESINDELNDFMYKSSHDLKGPLASIIAITDLAAGKITEKERMQYIDMISKSTTKLSNILDDLLNAARIGHGEVQHETINIADFIAEISGILENTQDGQKTHIEIEADKKLEVKTDKNLLRNILHNLIENSIKYRRTSIDNCFVKISAHKQNSELHITVTDNGQGIPEKSLPKVFDMFVRANITSPGTGLGLYLVKKSVDKLNGTIKLNSKEGKGTTIDIFLPEPTKLVINEFV